MSVVFVPGSAPSYNILSSDINISASTVSGVSYVGATVYALDTKKTYKVLPDLTLIEFMPITNDSWAISLLTDVSGSISSKTFTVPNNTEYQVLSIWVEYTSTSTVADRQLSVDIMSGSTVIANICRAGTVQAESLTRYYLFAPGCSDMTNFRNTDYLTAPLPATSILTSGQTIRIWDKTGSAADEDNMYVRMQVASRTTF